MAILESFAGVNEKYIEPSVKEFIINLINSYNTEQLEEAAKTINNKFFDGAYNSYIGNYIIDQLLKKQLTIKGKDSIWLLGLNYNQITNKKLADNILEKNVAKLAVFMIYQYKSVNQNKDFFDLIFKNKRLAFVSSLILLNNFKELDKETSNQLLDSFLNNPETMVPAIYTLSFNYNRVSEKLKTKLLDLSKNKNYSDHVASALLKNDTVPIKERLKILDNLKNFSVNQENLIRLYTKNYEFIGANPRNELIIFAKDTKLKQIILDELYSEPKKTFKDEITNKIIKDDDTAYDLILSMINNNKFDKDYLTTKYPKFYISLKERLAVIYSDKMLNENLDADYFINTTYLDLKLFLWKNWFSFSEELRNKLKPILYNENTPNMGVIMLVDFTETNGFVNQINNIFKNEIIKNPDFANNSFINELFNIDRVNLSLANIIFQDKDKIKTFNKYFNNKKFLQYLKGNIKSKDYINNNFNNQEKKALIINFATDDSTYVIDQYRDYLSILDLLDN